MQSVRNAVRLERVMTGSIRRQTAVRPQIGGHVRGKEKISRPSASLPQRLADGDAAMRAEAKAQLDEIKKRELDRPIG